MSTGGAGQIVCLLWFECYIALKCVLTGSVYMPWQCECLVLPWKGLMCTAVLDPWLPLVHISWSVCCRILANGAAVNYQDEEF